MSTVSQQNEDLPDPHSLCSQTPVPRASFHEHCNKTLHEALGSKCAVGSLVSIATMHEAMRLPEFAIDLMSTSFPRAYQDRPQALLSVVPISAIFDEGIFLNIAMALEKSHDLDMHDGMRGRSKKQGYDRDLLCMLFPAWCDL